MDIPKITPAAHSGAEWLRLNIVKPSHEDGGYVIQWVHFEIPSNMMASLNGIALDCNNCRALGELAEKLHAQQRGGLAELAPATIQLCRPLAR